MTPDFLIRLRPATMWRKLQLANTPSFSVWRKLQLANTPSTPAPARGFTLTEMLVVVGIIASILALLVPTLQSAIKSARSAAIKAEIDMLHMAIMNYKAEYGSFPPCVDTRYDGINAPSSAAPNTNEYSAAGEAYKHLKRIFPRSDIDKQLNPDVVPFPNSWWDLRQTKTDYDAFWLAKWYAFHGQTPPANADLHLIPHNAIALWLQGFHNNNPTIPLTGMPKDKMFDFDKSRLSAGVYTAPRKPSSPYIYIDSSKYAAFGAEPAPDGSFFNEDTFQILCAGVDEIWGTDDDVSNFWPTNRKTYSDSLNQ